MKLLLENIAENLNIPHPSRIVVQYWGVKNDSEYLEHFTKKLGTLHSDVSSVLFDKDAMIQICHRGPFDIQDQVSNERLENANVVIDLCRFSPTSLVSQMSVEARPNFVHFMRHHFSVITAPGKMMLQIRVPSEENAMESGLTLEAYTQTVKQMSQVSAKDLNDVCDQMIEDLSKTTQVTIETEGGHTLSLAYDNRKWYKDAGEGDFPAGEVYIAPLENSANGTYKVDFMHWEGEHFKDVVLTFEAGRLTATSVSQIFDDLMMADANAMTLAEFGLGVNPKLNTLTGHSLFDEKMLGSCHIAVGMNCLFGGTNESVAHVDFVSKNPKLTYTTETLT